MNEAKKAAGRRDDKVVWIGENIERKLVDRKGFHRSSVDRNRGSNDREISYGIGHDRLDGLEAARRGESDSEGGMGFR